jgi:hypothetical protein
MVQSLLVFEFCILGVGSSQRYSHAEFIYLLKKIFFVYLFFLRQDLAQQKVNWATT